MQQTPLTSIYVCRNGVQYFVYGNINGMKSMEECTVPVKITCCAADITHTLAEARAPDPSGDTLAKIFAIKIPVPSN